MQKDTLTTLLQKQAKDALQVLKAGGVILYPTDTVWGLGCDATNTTAVQKIYDIKKRSYAKSMITLVSNAKMACNYLKEIPEQIQELLENTPLPQTVIFENPLFLAPNLIPQENTSAFRVPKHPFCQELLNLFQKPIVSTSANISGEPTPLYFQDISQEIINRVDFVVNPLLEEPCTHQASRIIFIKENKQIIIRK